MTAARTRLGALSLLSRGAARAQPLGRSARAVAHAADDRPPYRRAGSGARHRRCSPARSTGCSRPMRPSSSCPTPRRWRVGRRAQRAASGKLAGDTRRGAAHRQRNDRRRGAAADAREPSRAASAHRVELVLSNRSEDLLRRDVDLAVATCGPRRRGSLAKKIGDVTLGLHAHRRYLEAPRHAAQPRRSRGPRADRLRPGNACRAVAAGQGPALLARHVRAAHRQRSRAPRRHPRRLRHRRLPGALGRRDADLVRLLPRHFAFELEIWLVMHENLRASRRMRAVFDHLGSSFSVYVGSERRRT